MIHWQYDCDNRIMDLAMGSPEIGDRCEAKRWAIPTFTGRCVNAPAGKSKMLPLLIDYRCFGRHPYLPMTAFRTNSR